MLNQLERKTAAGTGKEVNVLFKDALNTLADPENILGGRDMWHIVMEVEFKVQEHINRVENGTAHFVFLVEIIITVYGTLLSVPKIDIYRYPVFIDVCTQ